MSYNNVDNTWMKPLQQTTYHGIMYLQNAKSKRKAIQEGRGRSMESSQLGVISANEKTVLLEILNVFTRGLVL